MAYEEAGRLSIAQLQRRIRTASADSATVFLTKHAKVRMKERKITVAAVLECLRKGSIRRPPEPNPSKGSLECRMERYCSGMNIGVVVALCDEDPSLLVVTVLKVND